jgi:hypothetical protein
MTQENETMNPYINTTTRLERLVNWREAMHRHGHEHFDMDSWGYCEEGLTVDSAEWGEEYLHDMGLDVVHRLDMAHCGTTACAAGHFVHQAQLTVEQVPAEWNQNMELYSAHCLGIDSALFSRFYWTTLRLSDDETLRERFDLYMAEHPGEAALCEWMAVLDWADHCIKDEMERAS